MIATSAKVIHTLAKIYTAKGMVDLGSPEDTLIATLLSARTRDEQVLNVYPGLRMRFPTLQDFANSSSDKIAQSICSIGLYRNKAKAIKALAITLLERHAGNIPKTMDELVALPGVGRKTASCVLTYAFRIPAVAVDVHVFRITHRLGWVKGKTPELVETELKRAVPKKDWIDINRTFVQFGRDVCRPGRPQCWRCPVAKWCNYPSKTPSPKA